MNKGTERRVAFSSKARTLDGLRGLLSCASLLSQHVFSVGEWRQAPDSCLRRIIDAGWASMAVRSSSVREDAANASAAGQFESCLAVAPAGLQDAIYAVIASMGGEHASAADEVFVQPMLENVRTAGVAFGVEPSSAAPYFVINYDSSSGRTDSVTSGDSNELHNFYAHHSAEQIPQPLQPVVAMLRELQCLFGSTALDVEFAVDAQGILYLLQVRPLVLQVPEVDVATHTQLVSLIRERIRIGQRPQLFLHGERTVYGVMPDWNPAEIIGVRPKPLALSLYRELVTDMIWAYQRNNYGYRNLRSFPLMLHFHGLPYIDVRVSFNSFVPRDLDGALADKLVNYYIERLVSAPSLHDKVEFEIVFSCYTLDLPQRLERLREAGFSEAECAQLAASLRELTNRIVDNNTGLWRSDEAKLKVLLARREEILSADTDPVSRIYWLLEDCSRYGTLPFAGLARAGFIAVQLLRSLVAVGVLDVEDYNAFLNGLNTVSGQMTRDWQQLDRTTFLSRYGHLRPGTYDILSPRYDEAPELYFDWQSSGQETAHQSTPRFALSLEQMRSISRLLAEHGLAHDVVGLFDFLQAGIELREYAKFVFTRNLSDALSLFRDFGRSLGFSEDDMAFANIQVIKELHAASADPHELLASSIADGRRRYAETCQLMLPPLITAPEDALVFHLPQSEPNFITHGQATGNVVSHHQRDELVGAIVMIPSADPGFDWLFSHRIAGFVTAYGGVNSHMAIRANELGLPAVIGAGEALYNRWVVARVLKLDCAARRVDILR
ncbi:phosphoenolpyruvate synthase [Pseudomonas sp. HMWF032]|uniref:PEP-utilizing enzyme n=1 Tax=Pseudomonas sp. HMWF032 TaxID=2056866 RepID=UPI000D3C07D9|nr:PEP-utilizing enzyme [Pseudomonas sp. HMWF032]PTS83638.1 phosphoenolpyruvate synthase [Pseudomonas sp. HMWF032]PTT84002.1 phosphoenolpyruvate synthase [Pseudomonas sp. HMWF010]